MNILQYIFYLGTINVVFGLVWKWVFVPPSILLFSLLKIDQGKYFVKAFGYYLLVSLTASLTLNALQYNHNILSIILFPFTGALIIYLGYASNYYEAQQQAEMVYGHELMRLFQYEGFFMIGAIVLFFVALFVPIIAVNPLTIWLSKFLEWANNLKVFGPIIGIGGVLLLLKLLFFGILFTVIFIKSIKK